MRKQNKQIGQSIRFKFLLIFLLFLPSYTQIAYDPEMTTDVISAVMSHPLVASAAWILPIAKALLLIVIVLSLIYNKFMQKFIIGYYAIALLVVGILQNMSFTEDYGFVWIIGNTLIQLVVLVFCLVDLLKDKTNIRKEDFVKGRLWVVPLMLLAFLMPYSVNSVGNVAPSFTTNVLFNEAAVTYCMITPVIIGILLLFSKGVYKPTLSIISYVGFAFGLLNMMTWFVMQVDNWWMGVLHLPLVILSFYGLLTAHKEKHLVRV